MNVLLGAYACMPNAGTEPGHGWGWAVHLAERGMHVTVLTKTETREGIEAYRREHPNPNLDFAYVPLPTNRFRNGGGMHYALWHLAAVKVARELQRSRRFDVAHHVTFGSVHVPTQLWRLGIPTVFGPVGGGQTAPANMLGYLGEAARAERLRTLFTRVLPYSPWHRRAMGRMAAVLAVNCDTVELVRAMGRSDVEQQFDIAIPESFLAAHARTFLETSAPPKLLWVGRIVARKGLPLALDALAAAKSGATLTIMGESADPDGVRRMVADRGLTGRVHWAGKRLPWAEVRAAYTEHDALLFTSIRETCGAQLLEAMALGLPVITLDLHGAHDLVPGTAGIKVPVKGGASVAGDLAGAIDRYATLPAERRSAMSAAGWAFAGQNTWRARAAMAEVLYRRICGVGMESGSGSNSGDVREPAAAALANLDQL